MKKSIIILFLLPLCAYGQQKDYSSDVKSVDSIIEALYEVISGDATTPRDWERFKNLFTADAKLIPTYKDKEGKTGYRTMSPADYEQMFTSKVKQGFFERELFNIKEEYGSIVHVFSTYETTDSKGGKVTARGINSIQLLKDENQNRYYIMNIFWSGETPATPLPDKYLKK